jgi:hypothetical protein
MLIGVIIEEANVKVENMLRSLGARLDKSAIETREPWKFVPAVQNGSSAKSRKE